MKIDKTIAAVHLSTLLLVVGGCGGDSEEKSIDKLGTSISDYRISDLSISYSRLVQGVDISKESNISGELTIESISNSKGSRCPSIIFKGSTIELEDKTPNLSMYSNCLFEVQSSRRSSGNVATSRALTRISTHTAYENSVDGLTIPPISLTGVVNESFVVVIRDWVSDSLLPEGYNLASASLIGLGEIETDQDDEKITFTSDSAGANRIIFKYNSESGPEIKGAIDITLRASSNNKPPELEASYQMVYKNEMTSLDLEQYINDDNQETVEIYDVKGFNLSQVEYQNKQVSLRYDDYGTYYLGVFVRDEDGILASSILTIEVVDKLSVVDVHNLGITSDFFQTARVSDILVTFF
ncbi:hypothetical protein L1D52_04140 [Vibrio brasiliensis]|uniref:hypothetical protein n=1 Tax=Vibrio brasiliensis TaxID=170652 RepID=UPI001EFEC383|nr:hypothetical protein [Vibrio brasiliensis]MCG9781531.1 hypothetical protein [Vibrio brasiliensis]